MTSVFLDLDALDDDDVDEHMHDYAFVENSDDEKCIDDSYVQDAQPKKRKASEVKNNISDHDDRFKTPVIGAIRVRVLRFLRFSPWNPTTKYQKKYKKTRENFFFCESTLQVSPGAPPAPVRLPGQKIFQQKFSPFQWTGRNFVPNGGIS